MTEIILLLLFSLILNFRKKPSNVLLCGIFAWTGDSKRKFSWDKFNLLGVLNDVRGGDSCGRAIGDEILVGLGKEKTYYELIQKYRNDVMHEPIAIGHTRKASYGYSVNAVNSQPIVVEEDGEIVFILAHNGTIHNDYQLRQKYPIDVGAGKTDSYYLAHIIYKYGFDVLEDYFGSASLVMYNRKRFLDDGDTVVHVFRGESKLTYSSTKNSEERPLHIYTRKNNSIYISSEDYPLYAIDGDIDEIDEVPANKVLTIINGVLQEELTVDINRSEAGQHRYYPTTNTSKDKDEVEGNYVWEDMDSSGYGGDIVNNFENDKNYSIDLDDEVIPSSLEESKLIYFKKGRYHTGTTKANGIIHINKDRVYSMKKFPKSVPFYFIDGVMIKNHSEYREAIANYKRLNDVQKRGMQGLNTLIKHSTYPLWVKFGVSGMMKYWNSTSKSICVYSGKLNPSFSNTHYSVQSGTIYASKRIPDADIWYPDVLFKGHFEEMKQEFSVKKYNTSDSIELPFDNDLTDEEEEKKLLRITMIRQQIAHELGDLLEKLTEVTENIAVLGEDELDVDTTVHNLTELKKTLIAEDDRFFNQKLNITTEWEELEEC